jgi:hypothetical protein
MLTYHKIWVGDKLAPKDDTYYWADTVNKAKNCIIYNEENNISIDEVNISMNDIGKSRQADGGSINDFEKWLKDTKRNYTILQHAAT